MLVICVFKSCGLASTLLLPPDVHSTLYTDNLSIHISIAIVMPPCAELKHDLQRHSV